MKIKVLLVMVAAATMGGLLAASATTPPTKPAKKTSKDKEDTSNKIAFKDVPVLQDGPGKGYYAIFQCKSFDALFVASNLNVLVYPKEQGERIDKPIEFSNRFVYSPTEEQRKADPKDLMHYTGVIKVAPPTNNPPKVVITAISDANVTLIQTWKFAEGKIEMEEHLKGYSQDEPPTMRTYFMFPQTHKFTANIEKSERLKATEGYIMRWHAGKTENAMKVLPISYIANVDNQAVGDWVENRGPWGALKITIKRKAGKGSINVAEGQWNRCPYDGIGMVFATKADPKTKKLDPEGFEVKIDKGLN